MTLACLLVDDEPLALDILEGYVRKTPFLSLAGRCLNAFEADEFIKRTPVDLMFLDIEMPDWSGMEFARALQGGPMVVFTTAYDRYALDGYKADTVDYLLKPVSYDEFLAASRKAAKRYEERNGGTVEREAESIFVKTGHKRMKIDLASITHIEGMKDYVRVHVAGRRTPVTALATMKAMEAQLPGDRFMRVHRSFIVNLTRIASIERDEIDVGGAMVPLSDTYKDAFLGRLSGKFVE